MFSKKQGMGGYSEYAFGKSGNFMANYTYGVSLPFANIAIAITCVGYGEGLFGIKLSPIAVCVSTICTLWVCTVANFMGASITGKISSFSVWCVIIPVLILSVIGYGSGLVLRCISKHGTLITSLFLRQWTLHIDDPLGVPRVRKCLRQ